MSPPARQPGAHALGAAGPAAGRQRDEAAAPQRRARDEQGDGHLVEQEPEPRAALDRVGEQRADRSPEPGAPGPSDQLATAPAQRASSSGPRPTSSEATVPSRRSIATSREVSPSTTGSPSAGVHRSRARPRRCSTGASSAKTMSTWLVRRSDAGRRRGVPDAGPVVPGQTGRRAGSGSPLTPTRLTPPPAAVDPVAVPGGAGEPWRSPSPGRRCGAARCSSVEFRWATDGGWGAHLLSCEPSRHLCGHPTGGDRPPGGEQ